MGRIVRHLRRRMRPSSAFWGGFWQGLAAPTMLYEPPSRKSSYHDANDRIADAWAEVGGHLWAAMGRLDEQSRKHRD